MTDPVPHPRFDEGETWDAWADELLAWGAEESWRRAQLAKWIDESECHKDNANAGN